MLGKLFRVDRVNAINSDSIPSQTKTLRPINAGGTFVLKPGFKLTCRNRNDGAKKAVSSSKMRSPRNVSAVGPMSPSRLNLTDFIIDSDELCLKRNIMKRRRKKQKKPLSPKSLSPTVPLHRKEALPLLGNKKSTNDHVNATSVLRGQFAAHTKARQEIISEYTGNYYTVGSTTSHGLLDGCGKKRGSVRTNSTCTQACGDSEPYAVDKRKQRLSETETEDSIAADLAEVRRCEERINRICSILGERKRPELTTVAEPRGQNKKTPYKYPIYGKISGNSTIFDLTRALGRKSQLELGKHIESSLDSRPGADYLGLLLKR